MYNYRLIGPDGNNVGLVTLNAEIQVALMKRERFLMEGPFIEEKVITFRLLPCEVKET